MLRKLGLITLLMLLCISGAALAQTPSDVFCGDLSAADCTILTNAKAADKTLDSAAFDLTVNTTVTNVPNMTAPLAINLTGSGSYTGASALHNLDATAIQANPGQFLTTLLSNFDGDLTLTLTIPPEIAAQGGANMPSSITLQVRLVDGIGYVNFDSLQPLLSQATNMNLTGWGGLDLASLLNAALQQEPDLFNHMGAMHNSTDMTTTMQQFRDPAFLKQFITVRRTDSGTGDSATFETTVDLAALMAQPQMQDMMRQQMQTQDQSMTQAEIDQAMSMSTQMFQNMTFTIDQVIGLSDGFTRSVHGTINFDTAAMMNSMSSLDTTATPISPASTEAMPIINIDFTVNYSSFNSAPAITAPTNVTMFPWQMLLGLGGTPEATAEMMTPTLTPTQPAMTSEPTSEMTAEPTSEMTEAPTAEMTTEPTSVATSEPTAEVTAAS